MSYKDSEKEIDDKIDEMLRRNNPGSFVGVDMRRLARDVIEQEKYDYEKDRH